MAGRVIVRRLVVDIEFEIDDFGEEVSEEDTVFLSILRSFKRIVEGAVELAPRTVDLFDVSDGSRSLGIVAIEPTVSSLTVV